MAGADSPVALSLNGIAAAYGRIRILHDVSFDVPAGTAVGLIGRNGTGKTTLLRAIMGLLQTQDGSMSFNGTDITRRPASERCPLGMGYVPQGRLVFPRLSVEDNLTLGALATKASVAERSRFVFDLFPKLKDLGSRRAGSLSGGQQQILAIGRALMSDPSLLILDEPSEGIQPSVILEIADTLSFLTREVGLTLLVVEQRLDFLARVVEHTLVMDRGTIVHDLTCQELVKNSELQQRYLGV